MRHELFCLLCISDAVVTKSNPTQAQGVLYLEARNSLGPRQRF